MYVKVQNRFLLWNLFKLPVACKICGLWQVVFILFRVFCNFFWNFFIKSLHTFWNYKTFFIEPKLFLLILQILIWVRFSAVDFDFVCERTVFGFFIKKCKKVQKKSFCLYPCLILVVFKSVCKSVKLKNYKICRIRCIKKVKLICYKVIKVIFSGF